MGSLSQRRIGLLVLASLAPACVMAPLPPPSHYVVSATNSGGAIEPAVPSEDPDQGLRVLDPNASAALRPGRTVAFFPPDRCRGDLPAASATATPEAVDMANDCGVLISALETSVADRYSVVSWQTLKGVDPFARAAERNVDIIFEVDSLGLNELDHDSTSQLRLDFYRQTNANDRALLNLGAAELPALAERCRSNLAALPSPAVRSFTGAIKAVEVSSGRALVYYQRTLADDQGNADASARDLYYRAQPIAMPGSNPYNMLQRTGGGVAALGAAAFVTGVVLRGFVYSGVIDDAGRLREPGTTASTGVLVAGAFVFIGGLALVLAGNAKAKKSVRPASFQAPTEVLCVQPVTPPWLQTQPATPTSAGGSSYSFTDVHTAARDVERERENRLRKLLLEDFTHALAGLEPAAP